MEHFELISLEPWWVQCMGLFHDGTVREIHLVPTAQRYCYTYEIGTDLGWKNVISLSSSRSHLAGLTKDGRVLIETRSASYHFDNVGNWKNVIRISAGYENTAGILDDGTLLYTGNFGSFQCDRKHVKDIILCARTVYAIDEGGTLFQSEEGETRILNKECGNIIQLGAVAGTIYGLTAEGCVKLLYEQDDDPVNWSCVTRLSSGNNHLLGLTESGRVLWKGEKKEQVDALNPDNKIIDIYAGCYHSVAVNEEGYLFCPEDYWRRY
jgi:hypothetical protein